MKNKKSAFLVLFSVLILCFMPFINKKVSAIGIDISDKVEYGNTKMEVQKAGVWYTVYENGSLVAGAPSIEVGNPIRLNVEWSIDDLIGNNVFPSDYFILDLSGSSIDFAQAPLKDMYDSAGNKIGQFEVDSNGIVKVILGEGINGKASLEDGYFSANGTANKVSDSNEEIIIGNEKIPVEVERPDTTWDDIGAISKQGWQIGSTNSVKWEIIINQSNFKKAYEGNTITQLNDAILIDHLPAGTHFTSANIELPLMLSDENGNLTWEQFTKTNITNQFIVISQLPSESFDDFVLRVTGNSSPAYGVYTSSNGIDSVVVSFKNLPGTLTNLSKADAINKLSLYKASNASTLTDTIEAKTLVSLDNLYNQTNQTGVLMPWVSLMTNVDDEDDGKIINEATLKYNTNTEATDSFLLQFVDYSGGANAIDPQSIVITKYEESSNKKLNNVGFSLQKKDNNGIFVNYGTEQKTDLNGQVKFTSLPYGEYKILESSPLAGYESKVDFYDENGNNILNKFIIDGSEVKARYVKVINYLKRIDIAGEKIWDDNNNQLNLRPDSITVNLLADGQVIDSVIVKANTSGKWLYSFKNLPVYKNNVKIKYTIKEVKVNNYKTKINGFNIVNTISKKPSKIVDTGSSSFYIVSSLLIISIFAKFILIKKRT